MEIQFSAFFYTGVKLGPSRYRNRRVRWECSRIRCWGNW